MPYPESKLFAMRTGAGPATILLHGNPASHTLWQPLMEPMGHYRTLLIPDLPGFGNSPAPGDYTEYSLPNLAATVCGLADREGVNTFDLVGHSFGGALAVTLAARAPERIRSLVLICPMGVTVPPAGRMMRTWVARTLLARVWDAAPGGMRRWVVRNGVQLSYGGGYTPQRARQVAMELDRSGVVRYSGELIHQSDYAGYQASIRTVASIKGVPILLVGCCKDRVVPFKHFQRIQQQIPYARSVVLTEGGHVPMWQYTDTMVSLLSDFYSKL